MRVGPPIPWTAVLSAQMTQAVGQAAGHRSNSTERPVEAPNAIVKQLTVGRVSSHTFDIRV